MQYIDALLRDHPFSTYPKVSTKLTSLTPLYAHIRKKNCFLENFAYALIG